jgi:hypothetical protein
MRILSLDLVNSRRWRVSLRQRQGCIQFATVLTTHKGLHDLIVDCEPDRVVIEICSIARWVCDLVFGA